MPAMRMLLDACGGAPVTLHRCIDVSRDLCATYRAAAALGIDTVLTSGGAGLSIRYQDMPAGTRH